MTFPCPHSKRPRLLYRGAEYVLAFQTSKVLTKVVFNPKLEILEINIPQYVINALGSEFRKNWGEFAGMGTLKSNVLRALKSKKTPPKVVPELILIEKAIRQAERKGFKHFVFYKLFTSQSHGSQCYQVGIKNHEKFHALCDVLRKRHRLFKREPQGKMAEVVELCRDALRQYTSDSGEDAVAIILKKMPTALGAKGWIRKWVSLVDVNLWRLQKLLPKDVAAKYSQATGLGTYAEEVFADLAAHEANKGMKCEGFTSTYSEKGIHGVIATGITLKVVVRELLNAKAAAKEILDFVVKNPGALK
jgi:hypothetical protein